jgi:hypothetical protein
LSHAYFRFVLEADTKEMLRGNLDYFGSTPTFILSGVPYS